MFTIILVFSVPILWFALTFLANKIYDEYDYSVSRIVSLVSLFAVAPLIITVVNFVEIANQKDDFESLKMLHEKKNILEEKVDKLSVTLEIVLMEKYPNHEKMIFDDMTPEDLKLLLVKYPEIQSALTAMNFTDNYLSLWNDYYAKKLEIETVLKDVRYRKINPWLIGRYIPDYDTQ